jgi:hypothetical protein
MTISKRSRDRPGVEDRRRLFERRAHALEGFLQMGVRVMPADTDTHAAGGPARRR